MIVTKVQLPKPGIDCAVDLPEGRCVFFGEDQDSASGLSMWWLSHNRSRTQKQLVKVIGTDQEISDYRFSYLATSRQGALVWHLFIRIDGQ